jgi:hypothetical protein
MGTHGSIAFDQQASGASEVQLSDDALLILPIIGTSSTSQFKERMLGKNVQTSPPQA